jgi:hypothetical protein
MSLTYPKDHRDVTNDIDDVVMAMLNILRIFLELLQQQFVYVD